MRVALLLASVVVGSAFAGNRSDPSGEGSWPRIGAAPPMVSRDPAVSQYWSDGCVREREFGYTQSANCRHPAYNGSGGYGYGYGPGGGYGYGGRPGRPGDTVIINRGGTVVIERPAAPRGGSIGGWGR